MKKMQIKGLIGAVLVMGLVAFTFVKDGGIKGMVTPADGVKEVVAVMGTDTTRAAYSQGNFTISGLKKGTYTVWVKAITPYKDTPLEGIVVTDTSVTRVGEIKLWK